MDVLEARSDVATGKAAEVPATIDGLEAIEVVVPGVVSIRCLQGRWSSNTVL